MPGRVFSEEEVRRMSEPGAMPQFGAQVDPLRPLDLAVPPGPAQKPPTCPKTNHLLQPVDTNKTGDVLFECMTCGYDAVYRVATNAFEQRPNRPQDPTWRPPAGWGAEPVATTKTELQPTRTAAKRRRKLARVVQGMWATQQDASLVATSNVRVCGCGCGHALGKRQKRFASRACLARVVLHG